MCSKITSCKKFTAVTIGFDSTEYMVSENNGSVTLNVRLFSGVLEPDHDILVTFNTTSGNATTAGS